MTSMLTRLLGPVELAPLQRSRITVRLMAPGAGAQPPG